MRRNPRVVAIIQARMGSTRLPGKALADIAGQPMLWHVVDRARRARSIDDVVVATSRGKADNPIARFCEETGIRCFRGSEEDVLDRYYKAALQHKANVVVRLTADCPLLDPGVVDRVVEVFRKGAYDYVSNTLVCTYPDGLDVEVFSMATLRACWKSARTSAEREHVTPYVQTSGKFALKNVEGDVDLSRRALRWTVDDPADLEFVRAVYSRLWSKGKRPFGMKEVLHLLDTEPALLDINRGTIQNEGYYKSLAAEPRVPIRKRSLKRSLEYKSRAEKLIPSCTQTFSKGPSQYVQGVAPVFLQRGAGSHVWDVDGNEYVDYPMALGAIILGHNYEAVTRAVQRQLREGTSFSLPHPLEVEVSALLAETVPCAEMVRFCKNGSDATSGAIRVARAVTGREIIACCGYHGWQDWYIGTTTRSLGVPEAVRRLTKPFEYNNLDSLKRIFEESPGQVAAVIMEPVGVVEPQADFLKRVSELASAEGALLVFDEVVTGFRVSLGGAQEYYGVTPDLACLGKAMANGYPIAAVVGRREIMKRFDDIFFSFTYGGEAASLAATKATIGELRAKHAISAIWERGRRLRDGYNVLAKEYGLRDITDCVGLPPRTLAQFRDHDGVDGLVLKSLFQQECLRRGILFSGNHNICFTHSYADIDYTLRVYRTAMETLADAVQKGDARERLRGEPVQPVFRRP